MRNSEFLALMTAAAVLCGTGFILPRTAVPAQAEDIVHSVATGVTAPEIPDDTPENTYVLSYTPYRAVTYAEDPLAQGLVITGYTSGQEEAGEIVLPLLIGGREVVGIGAEAFKNAAMQSVVLPDTITTIGTEAFAGCTALTDVTIEARQPFLAADAFAGTPWLENQLAQSPYLVINDTLVQCTGTDAVLTLPETEIIGRSAFYGNTAVTAVTIAPQTRLIGDSAFSGCSQLQQIEIPGGCTQISGSAFLGSGLKNVSIATGVTQIGSYAFFDTPLSSVFVPASVTEIGEKALGYVGQTTESDEKQAGFTITGYAGTAAQTYAQENGFAFIEAEYPDPYEGKDYADLNGDGMIDTEDAFLILSYFSKVGSGGTDPTFAVDYGDLDYNETVDTQDAYLLLSYFSYKGSGGTQDIHHYLVEAFPDIMSATE